MWSKKDACELMVEMQIGEASMENRMDISQNIKNWTIIKSRIFTSGYISKGIEKGYPRNICSPMSIAVLFTTAKVTWQGKCSSIDEWI